ncbi:MAG: MarR family transcriptional regulator [Candidatus Pacearchaeota archaeon]|nr:MAG: MarR family transcriptional regulator [Candidatus Pacearchaeota archaeon]
MNKREWKKEIFLKKGRLRKEVLSRLKEPKTATELAKEMKKHRSSISRILLELEKKGFIKCINPKDDRFRHYVKK